jgi:hypothetical protein
MSGARLDLGENELALAELEIRELDPAKVFEYSVALFWAYSDTLEVLGRETESKRWAELAERAEKALNPVATGDSESISVLEEIEIPLRRDEQEALREQSEAAEERARQAKQVEEREPVSVVEAEERMAPEVIELDFGDGRPSTRKPSNDKPRGRK